MAEAQTITRNDLQAWLLDRLSFYLDKPAENIDPARELAHYGVDSVYAVSIISEIEDRYQVELDLAEARRHKTVNALADYVVALVS